MKKILVAVPASHAWFWLQTCVSCLKKFPPQALGCECQVVVVDSSWNWSPSIRGITETRLGEGVVVFNNPVANKFHASALDAVVERFDFDYLFALETHVSVLRHGWLQWFMDQLERDPKWYAAGHWHHEQFINPSCTLYRAGPLRAMLAWCKANTSDDCRWGANFEKAKRMDAPWEAESVRGPFAEKRGWPEGTKLLEKPSGQEKGPGWYEPGQALYAWVRHNGDWGYAKTPTFDFHKDGDAGWPIHTYYGRNMLEARPYELSELFDAGPYACHFWRGTGALNILKHSIDFYPKEYDFLNYCLPREGRFWLQAVDANVREKTLALIKKYGWMLKSLSEGKGPSEINDRDRKAVEMVETAYRRGGVPL